MDKEIVKERIQQEIEKIDKKENRVFFFVIDTKGNPSGSLSYIYKMAKFINDEGYNVTMLYQKAKEEDFVGVGEWLGEEYSNLDHKCVSEGDLNVSPSDVLFIPEIFSNVMVQTKKLPCKRIAILQNYNYLIEQMPFSVQWGDLGIMECVTNTENNANLISDVFPYVKTTVITPYIDEKFGEIEAPKKMIINVVSKDQGDINKIVKPFYWKYPMYRWVSFRELRGLNQTEFANALREAEITIWCDYDSSFGYSALDAMKSGNIVFAKTTENEMPWSVTDGKPNDSCIWFDNFNDIHKMIASVIRAIITEKVPDEIKNDAKAVTERYTKDNTQKSVIEYFNSVIENRKNEIKALLTKLED